MWFNVIIVLFQVIFFQLVWFPLSCNLKYSIFGFKLWCVLVWNTKIELTMEHEKMESTKKQKQIKHIICISTNKLFHYIFNRITARCALTTFKISAHSLKIANIRGKHITVKCIWRTAVRSQSQKWRSWVKVYLKRKGEKASEWRCIRKFASWLQSRYVIAILEDKCVWNKNKRNKIQCKKPLL